MTTPPKKRTKRTDITENQAEYLRILLTKDGKSGPTLKAIGLSRETLSRWREDPEFREREACVFEELEAECLRLLKKRFNHDTTALIFRLKSLNPDLYDEGVRREKIRAEALTDPERVKPVTVVLQRAERKPKPDLAIVPAVKTSA
ncbi:MAG: hypothetical protein E6R03_17630 [Hyphomicrobiaceae bacterium]|jgi:hypothetical protein|nr:MAG: hypothetical protein E6R03_17630 [Hyphomicrobiaceae bacterium]